MQHHTCIAANHAASKAIIEALNERDHVSLAIGGAQVHRIALFFQPSRDTDRRLLRIDALPLFFRVGFTEQPLYRHIHKRRV